MKSHKTGLVIFISFMFSVVLYSQDKLYTVLDKNNNENGFGLVQELSANLDTLTLKCDKQILRVRFLSHAQKETISIDVVSKIVRIPLYHFEEGRYTIAVYSGNKIIVLGFNRLLPIEKPEDVDLNLEKSILKSSLSAIDLKSRGLETNTKTTAAKIKIAVSQTTIYPKKINKTPPQDKEILASAIEPLRALIKQTDIKSNPLELVTYSQEPTLQSIPKNTSKNKIEYNITGKVSTTREMETRDEFRERSVRPNGKKYD